MRNKFNGTKRIYKAFPFKRIKIRFSHFIFQKLFNYLTPHNFKS